MIHLCRTNARQWNISNRFSTYGKDCVSAAWVVGTGVVYDTDLVVGADNHTEELERAAACDFLGQMVGSKCPITT